MPTSKSPKQPPAKKVQVSNPYESKFKMKMTGSPFRGGQSYANKVFVSYTTML